jgi:hypothetical protein
MLHDLLNGQTQRYLLDLCFMGVPTAKGGEFRNRATSIFCTTRRPTVRIATIHHARYSVGVSSMPVQLPRLASIR